MTAGAATAAAAPAEFVAFAAALADAAGAAIRPYFRAPIAIDSKADASPVTIADRAAEDAMRRLIGQTYPDHGILGEEFGAERADARYVWALDPIDGTRSFITGKPLFGTLVALCDAGRPIIGIIDQPVSGERWTGCAGRPTLFNGTPVRTQRCAALDEAALYTTGTEWYPPPQLAALERLRGRVKMTQYSADCYAVGLLALGFVDLVVECGLHDHDFAALVPVVEGAGGIITDWQGAALTLASDGRIVAAGDPAMHSEALRALAG